MAYGRRGLMVYEAEDFPESKDGHRGKRGKQQLSDCNHDVAVGHLVWDSGGYLCWTLV